MGITESVEGDILELLGLRTKKRDSNKAEKIAEAIADSKPPDDKEAETISTIFTRDEVEALAGPGTSTRFERWLLTKTIGMTLLRMRTKQIRKRIKEIEDYYDSTILEEEAKSGSRKVIEGLKEKRDKEILASQKEIEAISGKIERIDMHIDGILEPKITDVLMARIKQEEEEKTSQYIK